MLSESKESGGISKWLILLLASAVLVLVVWPSSLFFLNDDLDSIPMYRDHVFLYRNNTRIFAAFVLYIDYLLYHRQIQGYIITNLLLHTACCFAGYAWCCNLAKTFRVNLPTAVLLPGILLFMWFGFHSEVICWTISRTASIGLLCFFCSWLCFMKMANRIAWGIAGFIIIIAGLLSYETLLLMPFQLLAWYFFLPSNAPEAKRLKPALTITSLAIAGYLYLRYLITHGLVSGYEVNVVYDHQYMQLPKNLMALLIRTMVPPLQNKIAVVVTGSFLLACLIYFSFRLIKAKRVNGFWWFLLANWLLSYGLFVTLGIDLSGNESDRYIYIPSFFFCVWFVYSLYLARISKGVYYAVLIASFVYHVSFLILSIQQFRNAGRLTKSILKEINGAAKSYPSATAIYVNNLPDKSFGIPGFRLGINNGLKWFYPAIDTSKIKVVTKIKSALPVGNNQPLANVSFDSATSIVAIQFLLKEK